jgi:hypothetical protein
VTAALLSSTVDSSTASADRSTLLPPEPATGQGRSHGTSSNEPFDRWFRYPAGFASDYVSLLFGQLGLTPGSLVIDPFAGAAVTGTAALAKGVNFFGIEAHPLMAELGALKLMKPPGEAEELLRLAESMATRVRMSMLESESTDNSETDLVRRCFTPAVLRQLVALRELIKSEESEAWHKHLKWALLATLRDVASVRVGWPYQRPGSKKVPKYSDPLVRFVQRTSWMALDIDHSLEISNSEIFGHVVQGDSRDPLSWAGLAGAKAHGCISSPPYLNNFDYADATRLEAYFWGDARTWGEMCTVIRSRMITATTQQSSVPEATSATSELTSHTSANEQIKDLTEQLGAERRKRSRGKEYDRVVPAYFSAITKVLKNLSASLVPEAPICWLIGDSAPYGVYVDTPQIIAELAKSYGLICERDVLLRRRGQRWAKNSTRHDVGLTERLILLRNKSNLDTFTGPYAG